MRRPRIAIPEIDQDVRNYTRAVLAAGMEPVVISVQSEQLRQSAQQEYLDYLEFRAEAYDGLLIPGGWDINPSRYGQENLGSLMVADAVDELQFEFLDVFVTNKKPVLGICRGHQIVNVYFGGSLFQDIPAAYRHACGPDGRDRVHRSNAAEGSWLAGIYGTEFFHNSAHHQAVDRLGEGLVTDSRCAEDGTVEALHHRSLPIYCVQWHPERMCLALERKDTVDGLPLFRFFCQVCGGNADASGAAEESGIMADRMGL